jgi:hypothetical protein
VWYSEAMKIRIPIRPTVILLALLAAMPVGCRRGTSDPAKLAGMAQEIGNVHLVGRVWLEDPSQADPQKRVSSWEQARLEVWFLKGRYRLDLVPRDGPRVVRMFVAGREYFLQCFPPQPDLPPCQPQGYLLPVKSRPDLWAILLQAGQPYAMVLGPVSRLGRLVPTAAPDPFPHHPARLAWFDLRPAGSGFPADLAEYRRLRLGLGPEDGLLHAWVGEFAENPKDSHPQILWRVVVFDRHESGVVRRDDLLLPTEAADAAWTDGDGRPIHPPTSCIQPR